MRMLGFMSRDTVKSCNPRSATLLAVAALLWLVGCSESNPRSTATATGTDEGTAATISGTVTLNGSAPQPEWVRVDADPQCAAFTGGKPREAGDSIVGPGNGMQNVFVYVKEGLPAKSYPTPQGAVVLDQQQCAYVPRVFGMQVGQRLTIRNSDPLLHTVRADARVNQRFNIGTPIKGMEVARTFDAPEVMVPVKCDMHPWMHAYVGVVDHPFFDVTTAEGRFSIAGVPVGTYTIEIWHERFGTQTQRISVTAGGREELSFTYSAP